MRRSLAAVLVGTFTLRFSTGLTGALLVYYLAELEVFGAREVSPVEVGLLTATFYVAELLLSPLFGLLSDRIGTRRVMQYGPIFGAVAVVMTAVTTDLFLLGVTRWLEGAAAAASIPSILGFIAVATSHDEELRGKIVARFEAATLAGIGFGLVAAGPLWEVLARNAFYLNAIFYGVSFLIYRYGVTVDGRTTVEVAHGEAEESKVYPQLERKDAIDEEEAEHGEKEHQEGYEKLLPLLEATELYDEEFSNLLHEFSETLLHHLDEEERDILNPAREDVSDDDRASLGAAWATERNQMLDDGCASTEQVRALVDGS